MRLLNYLLVIASITLVGCGDVPVDKQPPEPGQRIMKIAVVATGAITLDGQAISIDDLRTTLESAAATEPVVWLYREETQGDPPDAYRDVFRAIVQNRMAVSFTSEPDFSTVVDHDGTIRPR